MFTILLLTVGEMTTGAGLVTLAIAAITAGLALLCMAAGTPVIKGMIKGMITGISTIVWGTSGQLGSPAGAIVESISITPKNPTGLGEIENGDGAGLIDVLLDDGLNDMAGNVWQWCWDWYGTPYLGGTNPRGVASGSDRVFRGGSWADGANYCRPANRDYVTPAYRYISFGFRSVLPPGQP